MKRKAKVYKILSETYKSLLEDDKIKTTPQASGIIKQSNIFNIKSWCAEANLSLDNGVKSSNGDYTLTCTSPADQSKTITIKIDSIGLMFVNGKQVLNKEDFESAVKFLIS